MTSWDDIQVGVRSGNKLPQCYCDGYWAETCNMVSVAYDRFWKRRGLEPPPVSRDVVTYPTELGEPRS